MIEHQDLVGNLRIPKFDLDGFWTRDMYLRGCRWLYEKPLPPSPSFLSVVDDSLRPTEMHEASIPAS